MSALYSVAEIRRIERAAQAELPAGTLMQRAGEACARHASALTAAAEQTHILILA
ncbi:MAG: bifunctional ADP-dependent NAD(P)H-hydrate dehydratase/NAD(P)H-hydrate epimerase, partial [Herbaspirillum sp.]